MEEITVRSYMMQMMKFPHVVAAKRLSRSAAQKSKNVMLKLVDGHKEVEDFGPVQLFLIPHPQRITASHYFGTSAPKIRRKTGDRSSPDKEFRGVDSKPQGVERQSSLSSSGPSSMESVLDSGSGGDTQETPFGPPVVLDKDYDPLLRLNQSDGLIDLVGSWEGRRHPGNEPRDTSQGVNEAVTSMRHVRWRNLYDTGTELTPVLHNPFFIMVAQRPDITFRPL
ncbi:unnamed protein product [Cyprideis torosa]|uniref:Uncharacterized protein n=1 Tax=Cyprideis torosa TaxID=163714 RepID=A0A7R8WHV1_9CRUS|nr:unnamed protein product [Cyprideis torosa]CAG0899867.1 unnamed protein product [Cyprideis torosa]